MGICFLSSGGLVMLMSGWLSLNFAHDDKKQIPIEKIRELILSTRYAPIEGRYRINIIDEAEKLNKHSANALLKTLEEPPKNSIIILITSNIRNIQPTILSRCALVKFSPLDKKTIQEIVSKMEDIKINSSVLNLCEGSAGKALKLATGRFTDINNTVLNMLSKGIKNIDPIEFSDYIMENFSSDLEEVFDSLLFIHRDMISIKKGLDKDSLFNPELAERIRYSCVNLPIRKIFDDSQLIYLTRNRILHKNANARIAIDNLFTGLSYGNY
jgi:DNA polymerase-3 subunit delta'